MGTRFLFRLIHKTLHVHAMCGVTLQIGTGLPGRELVRKSCHPGGEQRPFG